MPARREPLENPSLDRPNRIPSALIAPHVHPALQHTQLEGGVGRLRKLPEYRDGLLSSSGCSKLTSPREEELGSGSALERSEVDIVRLERGLGVSIPSENFSQPESELRAHIPSREKTTCREAPTHALRKSLERRLIRRPCSTRITLGQE